jgi:hypothetical protein
VRDEAGHNKDEYQKLNTELHSDPVQKRLSELSSAPVAELETFIRSANSRDSS